MKPVDMKLTKRELKTSHGNLAMVAGTEGPRYPWGLELRLDEEALKKLGMTELPETGAECMVTGIGRVTAVEDREQMEGGKTKRRRNVSIQIEKLALGHDDMEKAFKRGYSGEE